MVKKITKTKILEKYLDDYGKRYYLREIASLLKKPHQSIKHYLDELLKEKVLIKEKRKNVTDYKLNFTEKKLYDYLTIAEKEKLIERLNHDILLKTLFEKLSTNFNKATFIIFGSFVNEPISSSDIDLAMIGSLKIHTLLEDFESVYNKKIHLIKVNRIDDLNITLIKEIYKQHLILNNTEKVIRFFGGLYEKNKLV